MQVLAGAGLPDINAVRQQYQSLMDSNNLTIASATIPMGLGTATEGGMAAAAAAAAESMLGQLGSEGEGTSEALQRILEDRLRGRLESNRSSNQSSASPEAQNKDTSISAGDAVSSSPSSKPKAGIDEKVFAQHFNVALSKIAQRVFILSQPDTVTANSDTTTTAIVNTGLENVATTGESISEQVESSSPLVMETEEAMKEGYRLDGETTDSTMIQFKYVESEAAQSSNQTMDKIFDGFWLLSSQTMEYIYKEVVPEQLITILSNLAAAFISVRVSFDSLCMCFTVSLFYDFLFPSKDGKISRCCFLLRRCETYCQGSAIN
jgi:hypothetical protein